jgi:hypothetical protein
MKTYLITRWRCVVSFTPQPLYPRIHRMPLTIGSPSQWNGSRTVCIYGCWSLLERNGLYATPRSQAKKEVATQFSPSREFMNLSGGRLSLHDNTTRTTWHNMAQCQASSPIPATVLKIRFQLLQRDKEFPFYRPIHRNLISSSWINHMGRAVTWSPKLWFADTGGGGYVIYSTH